MSSYLLLNKILEFTNKDKKAYCVYLDKSSFFFTLYPMSIYPQLAMKNHFMLTGYLGLPVINAIYASDGLCYRSDEQFVATKEKMHNASYGLATVILQGHMDMVCEKTADSNHDFLKDPIKLIVDGDNLHADRTTLGGDDGIAVAYALAILDSKSLAHPPLEVLIPTTEEVGMDGARALKADHLQGRILFNIDSEEEGVFLVSCAGGANTHVDFNI